jgi:hypothetical protein
MIIGPALLLNKEQNFMDNILLSMELITDAEIFVETFPGYDKSLIQQNCANKMKQKIYPDPNSSLRVREEILWNKCIVMVSHFASQKSVTNGACKQNAVNNFYIFYLAAITEKHPQSYNSYTGMVAVMDSLFLEQSETHCFLSNLKMYL